MARQADIPKRVVEFECPVCKRPMMGPEEACNGNFTERDHPSGVCAVLKATDDAVEALARELEAGGAAERDADEPGVPSSVYYHAAELVRKAAPAIREQEQERIRKALAELKIYRPLIDGEPEQCLLVEALEAALDTLNLATKKGAAEIATPGAMIHGGQP